MGKFVDLSGQVFGRLTVLCRGSNYGTSARFMCECQCGTVKTIMAKSLRSGVTKSCGCISTEKKTTHGLSQNCGTYRTWGDMRSRCTNPNNVNFKHYGGRGIDVCDKWLNSFESFLEDMGMCPEGLSLDRINNDKGYSPDNCRWATRIEQRNNQRESLRAKRYEYNSEMLTLKAISSLVGLPKYVLQYRVDRLKWPIHEAVSIAVNNYKAQGAKSGNHRR